MNKTVRESLFRKSDYMYPKPDVPISDERWKELIDQQEFEVMIVEIREEILTKVFEEYGNRIKNRCNINFVVECSHLAWKQILKLNFFFHDGRQKTGQVAVSSWLPDSQPEICVPDSWASGYVPLNVEKVPKSVAQQTSDSVSDFIQIIPRKKYPNENKIDEYFPNIQVPGSGLSRTSLITIIDEDKNQATTMSTFNVHFTHFKKSSASTMEIAGSQSSLKRLASLDLQSNAFRRDPSEPYFYKILKKSTSNQSGKICAKKDIPNWINVDEIKIPWTHPTLLKSFVNINILPKFSSAFFFNERRTSRITQSHKSLSLLDAFHSKQKKKKE